MYPTGPRPTIGVVSGGGRIPEYLENLKAEFESLAHDANMYKMQRDDYERKLQAQLGELNNIQQTLYDIERNHTKIKQQYEEEILRLRRQLDMQSGGSNYGPRPVSPGPSPIPSSAQPRLNDRGQPLPITTPTTQANSIPEKGPGGMFYGGLAPLQEKPPGPQPSAIPAAQVQAPPPQARPSSFQPTTPTQSSAKRPRDPNEFSYPPGTSGFAPVQPELTTPTKQIKPSEMADAIPEEKVVKAPPAERVPDRRPERMQDNGKQQISIPEDKTKGGEESDWIVGFNPGVPTGLNIDLLHTLDHSSVVCCVKFSNDGKYMATGCNKSAQIYDVETGEKIHTFAEDLAKDGDLYIRSVAFSPDGRYLAAGAEDKTVKLWDIETKRLVHTFVGHELDIYSLDFSRDGHFIVSGSGDKKAKIWDVEKGECLFTLGNEEVGPKDGVTSVAFSPDGRLVAAGSLDRIVRLWDAQTGYFLERYEGHLDSVYSVAFSPDGKSLASGSLDKTLKLWELSGSSRARSRCRSTFSGHKDFVLSVAFSPDGNWLISGSKDRSVQFWDPKSAVTHMMLQGHKNSVISVAVSPAGKVFATGSGDFRARIWKYE